jgi:hypothetical protein
MSLTHCFQNLSPWLCAPLNRIGRAYLEAHIELLNQDSVHSLDLLIARYDDAPDEQRRLRMQQEILRDAILRGGTPQAVREAYVNAFGGLVLELPVWLLELEQVFLRQPVNGWTERGVVLCKMRLYAAIRDAEETFLLAPEIIAELHYQLASFFAYYSPEPSANIAQKALHSYQASSQVYNASRYPQQYRKVQAALEHLSTWMPDFSLSNGLN